MVFAEWVRERRLARGWTQAELARRINGGAGSVSRWERGEFLPDLETFRSLCVEFGCSADEPLGLPDDLPDLKPAPSDPPHEGAA